jgi:tRNA-binding EMAP/Myf-like protein
MTSAIKPEVSFEIFNSLDIRMCRVDEVVDILKNPKKPAGDDNPVKAYRLVIDTGVDKRECVTNIVGHPKDSLLGNIFPFILNLPEADIRGVRSRAMIIASNTTNGVALLTSSHIKEPGGVVI